MLLLPALRSWLAEHRDAQADLIIAGVTSAVGGRDTDAAAVWLGSILLAASLLPIWAQITSARRRPLPALLSFGDGLEPPPVPPQVTILNPPYGRVRLTTQDRRRWDHAVYGHANRYGLFMAAAVDYSAPGGVVSALVPAGWLGGAYFQRLRAHLARTAPLMHLTYVTDRRGVFSTDVLQETVIATFRKGGTARGVICARLNVNGETVLSSIGAGSVPERRDLPWLLPRSADDLRVVEAISSMPHRLSYYGWRASTGPLVWNRHKSQLSAVPERGSVRIIWAADIDGGVLHEDPARAAMRWVAPRTPAEERTLVLSDPAVLVQRTTAPEQGRRIVVTTLDESTLRQHGGRVVVENHVNVLTCANPTSVLAPDLLARLLGSRALDRVYRCITGSVATSAYELAAIPLPRPEILAEWAGLPLDALNRKIDEAYGLAP